jgi:hypothetical protein
MLPFLNQLLVRKARDDTNPIDNWENNQTTGRTTGQLHATTHDHQFVIKRRTSQDNHHSTGTGQPTTPAHLGHRDHQDHRTTQHNNVKVHWIPELRRHRDTTCRMVINADTPIRRNTTTIVVTVSFVVLRIRLDVVIVRQATADVITVQE